MTIKNLLSDLDGVIRLYPKNRDQVIEERYQLPKGSLFDSAFRNPLLQEVVCGRITDALWRKDILGRLKAISADSMAESTFDEWNSFPGNIDNQYLLTLKERFGGLDMSILTNGTDRLKSDLCKLGIENSFYRIFNSSEIGYCKPQVEIYHHVISELRLSPSEILFIDDSKAHIEAAQNIGFKTIHYKSFDHFQMELNKL